MNTEQLLQVSNAKGMSMERHLFKEALWFLICASRSEKELSASEFFDKNVKIPRNVKKFREKYRDLWCATLLEQISLLPVENKNLLSMAFVESQPPKLGFSIPGILLKCDLIAWKNPSA